MEFVAKKKTLKVSVDGASYEMRCPTIGERQEFFKLLNESKPENAVDLYGSWFESLGLPLEAFKKFDADDLIEFVEFVSNPKKKQTI